MMPILLVGAVAILAPAAVGDSVGLWLSIGIRLALLAAFVFVFLRMRRSHGRERLWSKVDHFLESSLLDEDSVLSQAISRSIDAGLPEIQVSRMQGSFLQTTVHMIGARRVLEIGTLGGYSAICMARALPADGVLLSLELEPRHAEVARKNLRAAGFDSATSGSPRVEVLVGPAIESLPTLQDHDPFDMVFIDADKANMPAYFEWALRLTRSGSLIVCDNVVRGGRVVDDSSADPNVVGVRTLLSVAGREPSVSATALQTVGSKGYDGFALFRVE